MVFISLTSPSHHSVYTQRQKSRDREWVGESERWWRSIWAGSRVKGGERANSIKSVYEGFSWVKHLLQMFGLWLSPCWRYVILPLSLRVSVRVLDCVFVCGCAPAYATTPKYICFSARCQSEATFFCTPTVACGTIIFVNAMLVTFCKGPEWSRPNKHRHGWFRLFFTLFSEHSYCSETLIQRQYLDFTRLEMNHKPI